MKFLLKFISYVYYMVISIRHWLFDSRIIKSHKFSVPIICVGNITVGGTGKTPVAELLVKSLSADRKVALLSRGYGRRTKGYRLVETNSSYRDVGDEPLQIKLKFPDVLVVVCERRVEAINRIIEEHPDIDVIVMDDGFQHRYVDPRGDYRYEDMHHGGGRMGGYEPVEFMGYCNGYYGTPDHNYRGERDYGYDMRGRRDYGYDYPYGDFGETLSDEELREWEHKLMRELDDRERQMFNKDAIMQKAKQMGRQMEGFGEKELYVATLMCYTDYKHTIGQNPDMAMKLAYDWLSDKDVAVKGAEKLAIYYDCIVEGE